MSSPEVHSYLDIRRLREEADDSILEIGRHSDFVMRKKSVSRVKKESEDITMWHIKFPCDAKVRVYLTHIDGSPECVCLCMQI